jgi:tRNA uracil 4-sulfurtransferase
MDSYIVRYGEIYLKGKNRGFFEKQLIRNIKDCFSKNSVKYSGISRLRGRIIVYSGENCECLKSVFGIVSISPALEANADINDIQNASLGFYTSGSFRISAKILGSMDSYTSQKINEVVGAYIVAKTAAKVSLKDYAVNIGIEIINKKAYIFNEKVDCLGGLPVGVSGHVHVLLENKYSLFAAYLMMKRGCRLTVIKLNDIDYNVLGKYHSGSKIKIVDKVPDKADFVVVSDTADNIRKYEFELLRPLIAYSQSWLDRNMDAVLKS